MNYERKISQYTNEFRILEEKFKEELNGKEKEIRNLNELINEHIEIIKKKELEKTEIVNLFNNNGLINGNNDIHYSEIQFNQHGNQELASNFNHEEESENYYDKRCKIQNKVNIISI